MARDTDAEQAYRCLRDLIIRTELKPGEALVESDLMRQTECGRTPLRDALHRLDHEGLVEILPRRGTFVSQVTISDLQQVFEVRAGIEDIVARLAAERCKPDDLVELRSLIERQAAGDGSEDAGVALDQELHRLLLRIAGNRYLEEIYRRVGDAALRLLYLTRCGMESRQEQARFMAAVFRALTRRDADALVEILRDHVRDFRERVGSSIMGSSLRVLEGGRARRIPGAAARARQA